MRGDWSSAPIIDLLESLMDFRGRTPKKLGMEWGGGKIPALSALNVKTGHLDMDRTKHFGSSALYYRWMTKGEPCQGDVLLTTEAPLGNVAQIPDNRQYILSQRVVLLKPSRDILNPDFLAWGLRSAEFQKKLSTNETGATAKGIRMGTFKHLVFEYPPLPEQERIVAILDEAFEAIDTAIANTEKNLANARELFESYLNAAILGELNTQDDEHGEASVAKLLEQLQRLRKVAVEQGRAKPAKVGPIDIELQTQYALPPNWEWVQLERLTVGISDGVHKKPDYTREGIPFIKVNNLTAGPGISFEDVSYISRVDHEEFIRRTHPEMGDILITKDGTIGVVRMIETDIEFSIFVSVALIKPVMRKLGPYLVYALRAPSVQSQIVPKGAALKHLYLTDLRRLAIPFPPLAVQLLIVSRIDAFAEVTQRLESLCQKKLTALKELKQSILQKAFSGELTASADSVLREASL